MCGHLYVPAEGSMGFVTLFVDAKLGAEDTLSTRHPMVRACYHRCDHGPSLFPAHFEMVTSVIIRTILRTMPMVRAAVVDVHDQGHTCV